MAAHDQNRSIPALASGAGAHPAVDTDAAGRWWPIAALFALGFLPRLYGIGRQSLWLDEVTSMEVAGLSWSQLLDPTYGGVSPEVHPPIFFLLLKLTLGVAEYAPAWRDLLVRIPAALAAGGLAAVLYSLGTQLVDRRVGWIAGLISVPSAFVLYHAQECRMYTIGMFLIAWQVWAAVRATDEPARIGPWIHLLLVSVATMLTHWFVLSIWPPLLAYGLLRAKSKIAWVGWASVTAATSAILLVYLKTKFADWDFGYFAGGGALQADQGAGPLSVLARQCATIVWGLWAGHGIGPSNVETQGQSLAEQLAPFAWSLGLACAAALAVLITTLRSLARSEHRLLTLFLVAWVAAGILAPIIVVGGYGRPRYGFVAMPALLLLLALAVREARSRLAQATILLPCLLVQLWACGAQLHDEQRWHPDYRALVGDLREASGTTGAVAGSDRTCRFLRAYDAGATIGFDYRIWEFEVDALLTWARGRTEAGEEFVFLTDVRAERQAEHALERLDREFEQVDGRRSHEVVYRRYRARAPK